MRAKLVVALSVAMLLIWLVSSGYRATWQNGAFVAEVTRPLDEQERMQLEEELSNLIHAAGLDLELRLNEPASSDHLRVFITRPSQSARTKCEPGNARYDSDSDVIVIDEGVIWPTSTYVTYAGVDVRQTRNRSSAERTWFHFAFLHELAHRELHRNRRWEWNRRGSRALEDEADIFAFQALQEVQLSTGDSHTGYETNSTFRVRSDVLTEPERSAVSLASVVQELSVTFLFGNSDFSSFYSDHAHDAFVARFRPRLAEALLEADSREAKTYVLLAMAYLDRVEESGRTVVSEIQSEHPIADVWFENTDLVVEASVAGDSLLYRLPCSLVGPGRNRILRLEEEQLVPPASGTGSRPGQWGSVSADLGLHRVRSSVRSRFDGSDTVWEILNEDGNQRSSKPESEILMDLRARTLASTLVNAKSLYAMVPEILSMRYSSALAITPISTRKPPKVILDCLGWKKCWRWGRSGAKERTARSLTCESMVSEKCSW